MADKSDHQHKIPERSQRVIGRAPREKYDRVVGLVTLGHISLFYHTLCRNSVVVVQTPELILLYYLLWILRSMRIQSSLNFQSV